MNVTRAMLRATSLNNIFDVTPPSTVHDAHEPRVHTHTLTLTHTHTYTLTHTHTYTIALALSLTHIYIIFVNTINDAHKLRAAGFYIIQNDFVLFFWECMQAHTRTFLHSRTYTHTHTPTHTHTHTSAAAAEAGQRT